MLGALVLLMSTLVPSGQPGPMQPSDYTPAGQSKVVSWQLKRLAPPSTVYITVDDVLRATAASSQTNEVVTISYRWIRAADGVLDYGQFTITPPNTRAPVQQDQPMAEGFLLSVSCKAAVASTRGQTFVRLFLNPKALGTGQPGFMLMSDYVTTRMAPGHPNGRILAPTEGPPFPNGFSFAVAAGAEVQMIVPNNARHRVKAITVTLTTSAQLGTRTPQLSILGTVLPAQGTQGPSTFGRYTWMIKGVVQSDALSTFVSALPDLYFTGNGVLTQIQTLTNNLQTGDVYNPVNVLVDEWLDNI